LKDNKQWDTLHQTLKAQTCYQDEDDALGPSYMPNTAEDIALFDKKQKYMYLVLKGILQMNEEKSLSILTMLIAMPNQSTQSSSKS
jgi:hypothetical protein